MKENMGNTDAKYVYQMKRTGCYATDSRLWDFSSDESNAYLFTATERSAAAAVARRRGIDGYWSVRSV